MNRSRLMPSGFTLLELLIAIAVFAVLSIMSYGTLSNVLLAQSQTRQAAEKLNKLQRAVLYIERDLMQIIARPVRDEYGDTRHAVIGDEMGQYRLEFTRTGHPNPMEHPRSYMQRVAYVMPLDEENKLYRYVWPSLDRSQQPEVSKQLLFEDVEEMTLEFYGIEDESQSSWPPPSSQASQAPSFNVMPRAIGITLKLKTVGEIYRLFVIPQGN